MQKENQSTIMPGTYTDGPLQPNEIFIFGTDKVKQEVLRKTKLGLPVTWQPPPQSVEASDTVTGETKYLQGTTIHVGTVEPPKYTLMPIMSDCGLGTQRSGIGSAMESHSVEHATNGGTILASNYEIRKFETGATRTGEAGKPDFEGFLSPEVIDCYGQYMHRHRLQPDGTLRASDNWQLGIPKAQYMKSLWRHLVQVWQIHRRGSAIEWDTHKPVDLKDALCAVIFNASGMLHEECKNAPK